MSVKVRKSALLASLTTLPYPQRRPSCTALSALPANADSPLIRARLDPLASPSTSLVAYTCEKAASSVVGTSVEYGRSKPSVWEGCCWKAGCPDGSKSVGWMSPLPWGVNHEWNTRVQVRGRGWSYMSKERYALQGGSGNFGGAGEIRERAERALRERWRLADGDGILTN